MRARARLNTDWTGWRTSVQYSCCEAEDVVHLLECVFADFPIGVNLHLPRETGGGEFRERIAVETFTNGAQVFF